MEPNATSALIAAGVALIVGFLTVFTSQRTISARLQATKLELEEKYKKALFDKRFEYYSEAWEITGRLSSRLLDSTAGTSVEAVLPVLSELDGWYNRTAGGLVLSQASRQRFFRLRELSGGPPIELGSTTDWYNEVWRRKMDFRISLRSDLFLEQEAYLHTKEEWSNNDASEDTIAPEEIARRQNFARSTNAKLAGLVSGTPDLQEMVALIIWHGSLPRGEGGNRYDFDYAVFLRTAGARHLLDRGRQFVSAVAKSLPEFDWRKDLHYDGVSMFEAHTHWDAQDPTLPHAGVHLYQGSACSELLGEQTWRIAVENRSSFFRELDAWRRFCFFFRHWIYEGVAVYDPQGLFEQMLRLDYRLPRWMECRLEEAVFCALAPYLNSANGICTVSESRTTALSMIAMLAYSQEDRPMGRATRYSSDLKVFKNPRSRQLLQAVLNNDLALAVDVFKRGQFQ